MHVMKEMCLVETNSSDSRQTSNIKESDNVTTMAGRCVSHCDAKNGEYQSCSHGYMPHHFSSRSRGWLKAIGKTSPHGDCLDPANKCQSTVAGQDESRNNMKSFNTENMESTQRSCLISSQAQLNIVQSMDNSDMMTATNGEHHVFNDAGEDLRKNVMLSTLDVNNSDRARPALTRQWSLSSFQVSGVNQQDCCHTNRRGHRSMSDLGFCRTVPGSNSRMLTLLQNPIFRKSLARTMRLDPEKDTFDEHVFEKLSSKMEEVFDKSVPLSHHCRDSSSEHSLRLCCSTSDLGMLTNFQRCLESSDVVKCGNFDQNIGNCNTGESGDASSAHQQHCTELNGRKRSSELLSSKMTTKQLSSFRIPSYREFKVERRRQHFLSKSAANLASLVPTILEEEDFTGDGNKTVRNTDQRQLGSEEDLYDGVPKSIAFENLNCGQDHKFELASLQLRSPNLNMTGDGDLNRDEQGSLSDNMTSVGSHLSLAVGKRRCTSTGGYVSSHNQEVEKTQESIKNQSQGFGKAKSAESQCDVNHKLSFHTRMNDVNVMLSDYASESNDECSDDLEDVLLMPAVDQQSLDIVFSSDVNGTLNEQLSNSSIGEVFSDSGCLIERKSFDSELAFDDGTPFKDDDGNDDGAMLRSMSDVSDMFPKQLRMRDVQEQRNKQSKSDPLNIREEKDTRHRGDAMCFQQKDSKEDILNFIENSIQETVSAAISIDENHENCNRYISRERSKQFRSKHKRLTAKPPTGRKKVAASFSTLERVDSGVGNENVDDTLKSEVSGCEDCGEMLTYPATDADLENFMILCDSCKQRRFQRKEAIVEIVDTEQNYGNDLNIISEHFCESMKNMGLLNAEQMKIIFINLDELISVNKYFITQLKHALDSAAEKNDELLWSVNIGQLFLDSSNMLLAYETYCINQSAAPVLLDKLLEEKDLLRIFLDVTQREKTVLRKMDLKSFLMVPVQRVMKYPLLLNRLYKVTASSHPDCDNILQAQKKIENILELINSKTKGSSSGRLRRRTSSLHRSQDLDITVYDKLEVHKVVMEALLDWVPSKMHFVLEGCLQCAVITDNMSLKRGRNLKYVQVHGELISHGKNFVHEVGARAGNFAQCSQIQSAALVLVKEKGNRPQLFRDPFLLHQCVVCLNEENPDVFEIHDANKDSLLLKCKQSDEMKEWFKQLQDLVYQLSRWRHRRNALANIMLHDL